MKTKLLLAAILTSTAFYAQCSRSGTFVENSPNPAVYPISGTANITETASGLSVNFEGDFNSVQGFKLSVFLSTTQTIDTDPVTNPNPTTFIRVDMDGDLLDDDHSEDSSGHDGHIMTGAKTFSQNLSGINLNDYKYVILQCVQFHVPWGYADLGALSSGCSLSVKENSLSKQIRFYPNPTKDNVTISNKNQLNLDIKIIDLLGKTILKIEETRLINQEINLDNLNSGVYLLQINSNGNTITKKLIKE
jgi:hypothetical protein